MIFGRERRWPASAAVHPGSHAPQYWLAGPTDTIYCPVSGGHLVLGHPSQSVFWGHQPVSQQHIAVSDRRGAQSRCGTILDRGRLVSVRLQ